MGRRGRPRVTPARPAYPPTTSTRSPSLWVTGSCPVLARRYVSSRRIRTEAQPPQPVKFLGGEVFLTQQRQLDNSSSALILVLIVALFASVVGISFSGVKIYPIFTIGLSTLRKEYSWKSLLWWIG